jgi:hypothetical protein
MNENNEMNTAGETRKAEGRHVFHTDRFGGLLSYEGDGGEVTVPEGVKCIREDAFAFCNHVTSVVLPEGVQAIAKRAFFRSGIKTISLPDSLTRIEESAFSDTPLEEIYIPDLATKINLLAFSDAKCLKNVRLPEGLKDLNPGVFAGCVSLEEIELPEGLKYIQGKAFMNCANLKRIALPKSLIVVWIRAFEGCSSLQEIFLPDGMKAVGYAAFRDCKELKKARIPKGMEEFHGDAFEGADKVELYGPGVTDGLIIINDRVCCAAPGLNSAKENARKTRQEQTPEEAHKDSPDPRFAEAAADDPKIGTGTGGNPELKPNIWQYFDRLSREEKIRELTHSFQISGVIDGVGWARVSIDVDDESAYFRISYIGSSPADFRMFAEEIEDGEEGRFGWASEPGSFPWAIQRRGGILYVSAPEIQKGFFISREQFLEATSGMTAEWRY